MRSHGQGGPGGDSPRCIRAGCPTVRSATSTTQRWQWPCSLVATAVRMEQTHAAANTRSGRPPGEAAHVSIMLCMVHTTEYSRGPPRRATVLTEYPRSRRQAVTAAMGSHGVDRANDTAACRARVGSLHCTCSWTGTRTAENCAQMTADAPGTTCG